MSGVAILQEEHRAPREPFQLAGAIPLPAGASSSLIKNPVDYNLLTYCFEPCSIKVYELDNSSATSAKEQLQLVLKEIPQIILPPPPLTPAGPVKVDMTLFVAENVKPLSAAKLSCAVVRLPMERHLDRSVDERALDAMKSALEARGLVNISETSLTGFVGLSSPVDVERLTSLTEPIRDNLGIELKFYPVDRYLPPTYYTTIAVYVAESRIPESYYAQDLNKLVTMYNDTHDEKGWVSNKRMRDDGWYLVDPSSPLLAQYLCQRPSPSGHYYDFVFHRNSSSKSFNRNVIMAARAAKDAKYRSTIKPADDARFKQRTQLPGVFLNIPKRKRPAPIVQPNLTSSIDIGGLSMTTTETPEFFVHVPKRKRPDPIVQTTPTSFTDIHGLSMPTTIPAVVTQASLPLRPASTTTFSSSSGANRDWRRTPAR
ncbi:hypothetical protein M231_00209 [Tremella mesenterica]|uniref:Uncharacterized protein n=1 Tax=Tremella mesenterica TaxID=5217 RepID=A0A4Q1BWV5_TREME|nr:hypothetical protein M231_00209 [Tremella mesenterica]